MRGKHATRLPAPALGGPVHSDTTFILQSHRRDTMNSVVHFEMPYDDQVRMTRFYEQAFGWQTQALGEEMGNYVLATTTETGESGPKKPGVITVASYQRNPTGQRNIRPSSLRWTMSMSQSKRCVMRAAQCSVSRWRYPVLGSTSRSLTQRAIESACFNLYHVIGMRRRQSK